MMRQEQGGSGYDAEGALYFAYQLGFRSASLRLAAEVRWQRAELDAPFPVLLQKEADEIIRAIERLSSNPQAKKTATLSKKAISAVRSAMAVLRRSWQGPEHQEGITVRDRSDAEYQWDCMMRRSPFAGKAWRDLERELNACRTNLPEALTRWAQLGFLIGEVFSLDPDGEPMSGGNRKTHPAVALQELLRDMREELGALQVTDINLSREQASRNVARSASYWMWLTEKVNELHVQIVTRFLTGADVDAWIPASEAADVAEALGVPIPLSSISKMARREPAPFRSRQPARNRLQIDLPSFTAYLMKFRRENTVLSNDQIAANIEKASAQKRQERG